MAPRPPSLRFLSPFVREILPGRLDQSGKGIKSRPKSLGTMALLLSTRNRRPRRGQERTLVKRSLLLTISTENVVHKIREYHLRPSGHWRRVHTTLEALLFNVQAREKKCPLLEFPAVHLT